MANKKMALEMMLEIKHQNNKAMIINGHDNAIIGMVRQADREPIVLYDPLKIIDNIMDESNINYDDAVAVFRQHIASERVGKCTPAILIRLESLGSPRNDK